MKNITDIQMQTAIKKNINKASIKIDRLVRIICVHHMLRKIKNLPKKYIEEKFLYLLSKK